MVFCVKVLLKMKMEWLQHLMWTLDILICMNQRLVIFLQHLIL